MEEEVGGSKGLELMIMARLKREMRNMKFRQKKAQKRKKTLHTDFMAEWIIKSLGNGRISPSLTIICDILDGVRFALFINSQDILEPII